MIYLQNILKRPDNELVKRIFKAQEEDPVQGDFAQLVSQDFLTIGEKLNLTEIVSTPNFLYKKRIKSKIRVAALKNLKEIQKSHSKVKEIKYDKLEVQPYLVSPLFTNEEVDLLYSLRSRTMNCKANFRGMYKDDLSCPTCQTGALDQQQHILECNELSKKMLTDMLANNKVKYDDIFGSCLKQKEVTALFAKLIAIREQITKDTE